MVELSGGRWRSGPLVTARSHLARLRGLRRVAPGMGILLRTHSVHTLGRHRPLPVIGIDAGGTVRWSRRVPPGRVVFDAGAAWMAEVPAAASLPAPGTRLRVVPMLAPWPGP